MNINTDFIIKSDKTYLCPVTNVIAFGSEGVLCVSAPIKDWEENDDVL